METLKIHRRAARKRALQCVFALSFHKFEDKEQVRRFFLALPQEDQSEESPQDLAAHGSDPGRGRKPGVEMTPEDLDFAQRLALGTHHWLGEIDAIVRRFSKHWKIERIARAELSILRLGVYEMLHESDIPLRVSINEAVELSKEFADEQSFPFVNGILDAVAKAVSHGEFGISKQF